MLKQIFEETRDAAFDIFIDKNINLVDRFKLMLEVAEYLPTSGYQLRIPVELDADICLYSDLNIERYQTYTLESIVSPEELGLGALLSNDLWQGFDDDKAATAAGVKFAKENLDTTLGSIRSQEGVYEQVFPLFKDSATLREVMEFLVSQKYGTWTNDW